MALSLSKMCRGQGVAYMLVKFSSGDAPEDYRFSATSESGSDLPLESYALDSSASAFNGVVLATPLLSTKKVIISAFVVDNMSRPIWSKSVTRSNIKWSSRLFYKMDWEAAHQLRDIDAMTLSRQIHVRVAYACREPKIAQIVFKGVICAPQDEDSLHLSVLDEMGAASALPVVQTFGSSRVMYDDVQRVETSFTLRVPDDGKTYCLVAEGSADCRSGFLCLDQGSVNFYCDTRGSAFYRAARPGVWDSVYRDYVKRHRLFEYADYGTSDSIKFSIVVPLYNTPVSFFNDMVRSVLGQAYGNWELILVNSTPGNAELRHAIDSIDDKRVKLVELEKNKGISDNTNAGTKLATGDFVVFFDHDDVLDRMALAKYAKAIAEDDEIDALYCDEDLLSEDGSYVNPHFKSDFNIDLLRAHNYITHLLAVRTSFVREFPLRKEFDGAQDYDFLLRLVEKTTNFCHVPEVLYHWRMSDTSTAKSSGNKSYAEEAGRKALEEHLDRCGLNAVVGGSSRSFFYDVQYRVEDSPLVSIVIPNKDSSEVLARCIDSLEKKTDYSNFEVVVVENNSVEQETFSYYERVQVEYDNVRIVKWHDEFNYSAINNFGFTFCRGDYYLLLNNDVEIINGDWLGSMLGFCQREDVGVVGAKLLYPDNTIQHAGVAMIHCDGSGEMGGPVHVFANLDKDNPGYYGRTAVSQDLSIVTGACLLTKKSVFESLGGLNENYRVAYNDVDYCLRVRRKGLLVVFDADAVLYHYESFSRGSDLVPGKRERFTSEQGRLRLEWPEYYYGADGYHGRMMMKDTLYV